MSAWVRDRPSLLLSLGGVATIVSALNAQQPPQALSPSPLTLQSAFALANAHNPTLTAARLGRAVDLAGVGVAEQRPNPEASFEAARDTPHEVLSLAFPLELGGKRGRRIDLANATLARTTADLAVQTLDVRRAVRLAYYELVAATAQVQITSELRSLAERTRNAARDRFESGAAPRLEALQAELALAQADNEEEAARGRRTAARTSLNTAIGRAPESPAEPIDPFDAGIVPTDPVAIVARRTRHRGPGSRDRRGSRAAAAGDGDAHARSDRVRGRPLRRAAGVHLWVEVWCGRCRPDLHPPQR